MKRFILVAVEIGDDVNLMLASPMQIAFLGAQRMQYGIHGAACEDVTKGVEALSTATIGMIE